VRVLLPRAKLIRDKIRNNKAKSAS
jgi:hypothetical protein